MSEPLYDPVAKTMRLSKEEDVRHHPYQRPRDSATLILIDRSGAAPKVLFGKRHAGHKFMPGKYVFPGGRIEAGDRKMTVAGALTEVVDDKLRLMVSRPSSTLGRALALAAIRETFEETGLLIGTKEFGAPDSAPEGPWSDFIARGVFPSLEGMQFVARAITPPGRSKRFDARFFAVDASAIADRVEGVVGPDTELTDLVWMTLKDAVTLDLPTITRIILQELENRIEAGFSERLPAPFYFEKHRKRLRVEL